MGNPAHPHTILPSPPGPVSMCWAVFLGPWMIPPTLHVLPQPPEKEQGPWRGPS